MKHKIIATCILFITASACYFLAKYYQAHKLVLGITILVSSGVYYYLNQKEKEQKEWNAEEE